MTNRKVKAFWKDLPGFLPQRRNSLRQDSAHHRRHRYDRRGRRKRGRDGKERHEKSGNERRRRRETGGIPACRDW